MLIKRPQTEKTSLSILDLLGNNEVALSKAFAFLLATEKDCYYEFLKFLGIKISKGEKKYESVSIDIERSRIEGRTDIELIQENIYHIIIECKVGNNKIYKQRTQYLNSFNNVQKKCLCFITRERDTNIEVENGVKIKHTSWLEIIELFNNRKFTDKLVVNDFLRFAIKNYKMKEIREVLIQDLQNPIEINRFLNYRIYRRFQTFGTPLYFAPYFGRGSGQIEGITNLAKVLGIITCKPEEIENFRSDLESFTDSNEIVENWIKGVKYGKENKDIVHTHYFLDESLKFKTPLKKDGGKQKGRGKNWIAAMIPPNRCVSFIDFIKHIPELN